VHPADPLGSLTPADFHSSKRKNCPNKRDHLTVDEREAIQIAAKEFKQPANKLIAVARR
jgi:hypothetical protein